MRDAPYSDSQLRTFEAKARTFQHGCFAVFLLPFALSGLGFLAGAFSLAREGNFHDSVKMMLGFLVMTGGPVALLTHLVGHHRRSKQVAALQKAHPDEPWLWREDWAAGRLEHSDRKAVRWAWLGSATALLLAVPIVISTAQQLQSGGSLSLDALWLFPIAGLAGYAGYKTRVYRKQGVSVLALEAVPATVGGTLQGVLYTRVPFPADSRVTLKLQCLRSVTTVRSSTDTEGQSTSTSSTKVTTMWEAQAHQVPGPGHWEDTPRTAIPVSFSIPPHAEPCAEMFRARVFWVLEASADVPGVDFRASFEVPVFNP